MSNVIAPIGIPEDVARFVHHLARHGDIPNAARSAGLGGVAAGRRLLERVDVMASLRQEIETLLVSEGAPLAVATLMKLSKSAKSEVVQHAAAKSLAALSGLDALGLKRFGGETIDKPLASMTSEELRALVDREGAKVSTLEAELAARAHLVNAQTSSKDVGFLD